MFGQLSFSEAPFSALSPNNYQLTAAAGSYAISGGAATFLVGKTVLGGSGAYALNGGNADFLYSQVLSASGGVYTNSGYSASFVYNQTIYAGSFSFHLNGNPAQLNYAHKLTAATSAFSLAGGSAGLYKNRAIVAAAGSYMLAGSAADFVYMPASFVDFGGGLPKKKHKAKHEIEKEQREELEAMVKREFDILDGTYKPEVVKSIKQKIIPQIKQIDWTEYQIALTQVNALLLKAKIQMAEYESELDDEESLLMLL